jgi:hypothetical protein
VGTQTTNKPGTITFNMTEGAVIPARAAMWIVSSAKKPAAAKPKTK